MGPLGGYLSSALTGEVYVPTFKPAIVLDETGCGDTFLTTTVLEILYIQTECKGSSSHNSFNPNSADAHNKLGITRGQLLHAFLVGMFLPFSQIVRCAHYLFVQEVPQHLF